MTAYMLHTIGGSDERLAVRCWSAAAYNGSSDVSWQTQQR